MRSDFSLNKDDRTGQDRNAQLFMCNLIHTHTNGNGSENSSGDGNGDEDNGNGNEDRIGKGGREAKKRKKPQKVVLCCTAVKSLTPRTNVSCNY